MRTAIISGTFDPITVGHLDVIVRASKLFDRVVVAVSANTEKKCTFPDEIRFASVKACVEDIENASVELCNGLLAEFCARFENPVIVRGARNGSEFDYERSLFVINKNLGTPETVVLPAESGMDHISSTYVRELIKYKKSLAGAVPDGAIKVIEEYLNK
jgi:pantetheine-phosphate adenylyltransferase